MNRQTAIGFVRWAWPLTAVALTVYAVWRAFLHVDFSRNDDAVLLAFIGSAFLVAVAFLVVFTRRWTLRALGQVIAYLADAGLYLGAALPQLGVRRPLTPGDVTLLRAGFAVSGTFLVVGLVWWFVVDGGRNGHAVHTEEWDGKTERRREFDRRKNWGRLS